MAKSNKQLLTEVEMAIAQGSLSPLHERDRSIAKRAGQLKDFDASGMERWEEYKEFRKDGQAFKRKIAKEAKGDKYYSADAPNWCVKCQKKYSNAQALFHTHK